MNLEQENYKNLTPFKFWTLTNFPFIEQAFDSLTNYELLCKLGEYLNNLEYNQNAVQTNMTNLYSYVSDYFKNLDVTEDINNKLDELASDGTLTNLISSYLTPFVNEQNNKINLQDNKISIINDKVNSAVSGSPAGVYSTLAELQSADPDHSKIYLVLDDGEWYFWNTDTSQWKNGGVYQSTEVGNNVIQIKNLSNNTQYATNTRIPTFNEINGYYRNGNRIIEQEQFIYTSPIELKKGETIRFKAQGYLTAVTIMCIVDEENNYLNVIENSIDSNLKYYEYTANDDIYISLCYLKNSLDDLGIFYLTQTMINDINNIELGTITDKKYINKYGDVVDFDHENTYSVTDYIPIIQNNTYVLKDINWTSSDNVGLAFYDISKNFISYIQNPIATDIEYTTPQNSCYVRHTLKTTTKNNTKLFIKNIIDGLNSINKTILNEDNKYNYAKFNSFNKFGVIGDSLASGECIAKDSLGNSLYIDNYNYSWGQYIAKKYGMECINFSSGGQSTKSWLNKHLSDLQNPNNKCNSYIIALGVNDCVNYGLEYLGSVTDIKTDYTQNTNSFYGNYGKIISNIKLVQPKAKIFIFTIPNQIANATTFDDYNNAIREIATLYNNVYLIDLALYSEYFTSGFIKNNLRDGHYNAISYNYMADLFYNWISKYMTENYIEFKQIEFIGTNYEY